MFKGLDEHNNIVNAVDAIKGKKYTCPCCHEELILKQGKYIDWHFAHKSDTNCNIDNDMCEWHLRMQSYFSPQYREITVESNGVTHRADILKDNYVIEFQHSPISYDNFNNRNSFYTSLGYKVIWVFDATEWWYSGRFCILHADNDDNLYKFKHPLKILQSMTDSKDISICFSDYDEVIDNVYNVYWHNDDWSILGMYLIHNSIILDDNINLGCLFYNSYDWREHYLKGTNTKQIYRQIKGYPKHSYECEHTKNWARDCEICSCCKLVEYKGNGSVTYCEYNKNKYNKDYSIEIPSVYIK